MENVKWNSMEKMEWNGLGVFHGIPWNGFIRIPHEDVKRVALVINFNQVPDAKTSDLIHRHAGHFKEQFFGTAFALNEFGCSRVHHTGYS